jgi:hypothetical protein
MPAFNCPSLHFDQDSAITPVVQFTLALTDTKNLVFFVWYSKVY